MEHPAPGRAKVQSPMKPDDEIVARIAVERGWCSRDTIQAFIDELAEQSDQTLSNLLRKKGVLDDRKQQELTAEQSRRRRLVQRYSDFRRADTVFGRYLVERGVVQDRDLEAGFYQQDAE